MVHVPLQLLMSLRKMKINWNIQNKLFIAHILLIILVISGMSFKQYDNQWEMAKTQSLNYHKNISQQLVTPLSLALLNNNYGNLTLPYFIQSLIATSSLYYLELDGITDNSNKFKIAYSSNLKNIWRMSYPENFHNELKNRIKKLNALLINKANNKKIKYLINRAEDELSNYKENKIYSKKTKNDLISINLKKSNYFDTKLWKLIIIKNINKGKGQITFIYNIKELASIQKKILQNVLYEFMVASIISIILLFYTVRWVTRPIEELTDYISTDIKEIDPDNLPGLKQQDEIGILASKFKNLLSDINKYIENTEEQANHDFLTHLYNRRHFNKLSQELINLAKRENKQSHIIMLDIDKFKIINDTYGHAIGDEVIKLLAVLLKGNTRSSDIVSRFGGDEFAILLPFTDKQGTLIISENIREIIESHKLNIDKETIIEFTISLGVANIDIKDTNLSDALNRADMALYKAKTTGRNKVAFYS